MAERMARFFNARCSEDLAIKFLKIGRGIFSRCSSAPKEKFGIAILDFQKFLAQPSRNDVVDEHSRLLPIRDHSPMAQEPQWHLLGLSRRHASGHRTPGALVVTRREGSRRDLRPELPSSRRERR